MATNEQAAGTNAEWDTDDDLNEANLREVDARSNAADFVERGCGFTADFNNDTLTIGSTGGNAPNYAIVLDSHRRYHLFPSQATVSLHASTTNHVFIAYGDVDSDGTDEVYYHVDDDNSAPSDPSLKIGEVDTSADTTTTTNREPSVTADEGAIGNVTVQQSKSYSLHTGNGVAVSGGTYQTIFDVASAVDVVGGVVFGSFPQRLRVTWSDSTTEVISTDDNVSANDDGGTAFGVLPVWPIKDITKLEFRNGTTAEKEYGWQVMTL